MTQSQLLQQLAIRLQDNLTPGYISQEQRIGFLQTAIYEYSKFRPQYGISEQQGTGTNQLTLPADWETTFSTIKEVEEVDQQDHIVCLLLSDYQVYEDTQTTYLRMAFDTQVSFTYRIRYTKQHTLNPCTIPDHDAQAIADYAAYAGCLSLAAAVVPSFDNTLSGAIVARKSQSQEYRELAQTYYEKWQIAMKLLPSSSSDFGYTTVTWNYQDSRRIFKR